MRNYSALLDSSRNQWVGKPPATDAEISGLVSAIEIELPEEYLELLRTCNGGEGELALAPLWFQLFAITDAIEMATSEFYRTQFKGLFFFGSNGGLESIALDMRGQRPWPIVMVDCIAGIESAETIAPNFDAFVDAIGVPDSHSQC